MRILSEKEDERFRERIKEEFGIPGDVDDNWEPVNIGSYLATPWREQKENDERLKKFTELLKERDEKLFMVAFSGGQYVPSFQQTFEEKYDSKAAEIKPEEILEVRDDLITFYIFPKDLSWIFLGDHEGRVVFSGEIIEEVRDIIDEEKLEEREY
ncbi:hypothetical protein [Candidatus Nanohalobium constans]|uniref:Uncharacterized protein n=1 Tax=Candidatus Nanohalobium constans TaxID=2565781 RepID=A0A5Q0UEP7_9ARCH|nr:hypothetical protein [Candidatus Nanohalobium constans]QGA80052.1 hypothetical protein LC1Nh_0144 [Candidatus Nanohalobium constans]